VWELQLGGTLGKTEGPLVNFVKAWHGWAVARPISRWQRMANTEHNASRVRSERYEGSNSGGVARMGRVRFGSTSSRQLGSACRFHFQDESREGKPLKMEDTDARQV